ncbi:MAG: hypothetical protein ISR64_09415 [Deltaproteobacteria bacterium]|nr:hypothetical protein [Deltaproteobacteria bacterium]
MKRTTPILLALAGVFLASEAGALEVIVGLPYGKHAIGHTAVRVKTFDDDREVIYDFGRYGDTWGYLGFHGEGVIRVWRGRKAIARYLRKQTSYRSSVAFVINVTEEEEKAIYRYYEDKISRTLWTRRYSRHVRHRLKQDYHGVTHQCTSVSLEGLKAVWPRQRWERLLDPRFNQGQGFNRKQREYFDSTQEKLGINEVVVPLDVIDAMEHAKEANPDLIMAVRYYRKRKR